MGEELNQFLAELWKKYVRDANRLAGYLVAENDKGPGFVRLPINKPIDKTTILRALRGDFTSIASGLTNFGNETQFFSSSYHDKLLNSLYNGTGALPNFVTENIEVKFVYQTASPTPSPVKGVGMGRVAYIEGLKSSIGSPVFYHHNPILLELQVPTKRNFGLDGLHFNIYNASSYACYSLYLTMMSFLLTTTKDNGNWLFNSNQLSIPINPEIRRSINNIRSGQK